MKNKIAIIACLGLSLISAPAAEKRIEQNEPPVISHFPTVLAYRGQPVPVYAKVTDKTGKVKQVTLYYALSQQNVPIEVPMKRVRDLHYSGAIPANFFGESTKVWYFVEARDSFDDKAETTWFPVTIKDPDTERTQTKETVSTATTKAGTTTKGAERAAAQTGTAGSVGPAGTAFPADAVATTSIGGIGAGTVVGGILVVGGGIAAASGGGGGGSDGGGGGGGGGGGSPTGPIEGTGTVSSRNVTICVSDFNDVQDDFYDIIVNGNNVGSANNAPGGSTCRGATLVSGANIITLRLTETKGSGTLLNLSINGGEFSRNFSGSSDHNYSINAP